MFDENAVSHMLSEKAIAQSNSCINRPDNNTVDIKKKNQLTKLKTDTILMKEVIL